MTLHNRISPTDVEVETPDRSLELLTDLNEQITQLLKLCEELQLENEHLTAERKKLLDERQELVQKCSLAEEGIDATIARLEALIKEE